VARASEANVEVATVLGSIPASSDTVDLRAADEAVLHRSAQIKDKKIPKIPLLDTV
jgi:hypothetical protein